MRLAFAGLAAFLMISGPLAAQTFNTSPITMPAVESGAAAAKPKAKAAPVKPSPAKASNARAQPGSASGRKWEDLAMPAPKKKAEDMEWPTANGGARPVITKGGGGGMALGF